MENFSLNGKKTVPLHRPPRRRENGGNVFQRTELVSLIVCRALGQLQGIGTPYLDENPTEMDFVRNMKEIVVRKFSVKIEPPLPSKHYIQVMLFKCPTVHRKKLRVASGCEIRSGRRPSIRWLVVINWFERDISSRKQKAQFRRHSACGCLTIVIDTQFEMDRLSGCQRLDEIHLGRERGKGRFVVKPRAENTNEDGNDDAPPGHFIRARRRRWFGLGHARILSRGEQKVIQTRVWNTCGKRVDGEGFAV